jgi:hypothetical protein
VIQDASTEDRRTPQTGIVPRWIVCGGAEFCDFRPIVCEPLRLSMTRLQPAGIFSDVLLASLNDSLAMLPSVRPVVYLYRIIIYRYIDCASQYATDCTVLGYII